MPNINSLDLAVGILSYNEADNIDFVVCQVAAGLERYFPHLNKVIINADLRSIRPEWVRYLGQTVFKRT